MNLKNIYYESLIILSVIGLFVFSSCGNSEPSNNQTTNTESEQKAEMNYLYKAEANSMADMYLKEGLTLEELAQTLLVGRTTLSNLINQEENVNFNTWINTLRIEEAKKKIIASPEYSILLVSELVGFSEQSNFSREFKKITGITPSGWKRQFVMQDI